MLQPPEICLKKNVEVKAVITTIRRINANANFNKVSHSRNVQHSTGSGPGAQRLNTIWRTRVVPITADVCIPSPHPSTSEAPISFMYRIGLTTQTTNLQGDTLFPYPLHLSDLLSELPCRVVPNFLILFYNNTSIPWQ